MKQSHYYYSITPKIQPEKYNHEFGNINEMVDKKRRTVVYCKC